MIDTDKYEGHTPVEIWQVVGQGEPEDNGEYGWHIPYWMACNKAKLGNHKADALLIADAPLFLEAYKRLQKEHDTVRGWFLDIDNYMMEYHYDMWQEIRKEIGLDD